MSYSVESRSGKLVLTATILGSGIVYLAGTTTGIAMPTIQQEFGASISAVQWIFNAFALSLAALLLLGGALGDHWGMRRLFIGGLALFVSGQVMTALAWSVPVIIAAQGVAGVGAAMLLPNSLAVVNACFEKRHRGRALGLWAGLSAGFAALGPFVGGWLVDGFGWASVFWMYLPFGLVTILIALSKVPRNLETTTSPIDWWGTVFIVLAFFGISFGLIQGPADGWRDIAVLVGLIGGVLSFAVFTVRQRTARYPMIPPRIFSNHNVLGANLLTLFLYTALSTMMIFIVFHFQQVLGMSATASGLGLLPPILAITLLSGLMGSLVDRIGPRLQATVGPILVAASLVWMMVPDSGASYAPHYLGALILFGIGMAVAIPALTQAALDVDEGLSGIASGISNVVSRTSGLIAIAVMGAVLVSLFTADLTRRVDASDLGPGAKSAVLEDAGRLAAITLPDSFDAEERAEARIVTEEAFVSGFRTLLGINAVLAALGAGIAFLLIRNPKKDA